MTFSKEDTAQKVIAIIADRLNRSKDTITPELTFKQLGADSLDIADITMGFEDAFGIEINDQDAERIKTVQEAIDLIQQARTK